MKKCKDCGKKTKGFGIRCYSCAKIELYKDPKNHPSYSTGNALKIYKCLDCGIIISQEHLRCKSCEQKRRTGKKSSNWQGGVSFGDYSIEFTNQLKREIRDRDHHECQLCHTIEEVLNRLLDVHHIDYDKENCKKENLISLCRKCNVKVNNNRDYYYAYFTYIMENFILCLN